MQLTNYRLPRTAAGMKDSGVPIAVSINYYGDPYFDGEPIPTIAFGSNPIVRCKDCRAYVNPFIRFTDGGTRWICNFCG